MGWPRNWEKLCWQLGRFYNCGPAPFWTMTGNDLGDGAKAANDMIAAELRARKNGW